MKRAIHSATLAALLASAVPAVMRAQQNSMPDMPGMSMPPAPRKPAQQGEPQPPKRQTPADMKPAPGENSRARAAERSVQNSQAQQRATSAAAITPGSDAGSLQHNTYVEQEFEAPAMRTGTDEPAPELLGEADRRPALTLQSVLAWAEASNPTLAEARALVARSEGQAHQAGLSPNPVVGYSGEHLRGGSYGGGENGAFAEQTIVLGGKLARRRAIFAREAAVQKIELEAQLMRVHGDVERAFYNALTVQKEVEVRRALLSTAEDAQRTAHELANLGQQDAPEVLDAEVETEQARVEYQGAQRLFIERFATLVSMAGRPGEPLGRLDGDLEHVPQLNPGAVVGDIVAGSPTVRASQGELDVAQAKLRDARREALPNLHVQAGAWWSGEQVGGTSRPAGWMGFAQAGVQVPLWNRNQGNVEAARAEAARARSEVARLQLRMTARAEPLAQRYAAARFQAERYRDQLLPRAERASELYRLKYGQMAAAYPQLLMSLRTTLRLRLAYLEALNGEWQAAIALRNDTLEGGLDEPKAHGDADTLRNLPTGGSE